MYLFLHRLNYIHTKPTAIQYTGNDKNQSCILNANQVFKDESSREIWVGKYKEPQDPRIIY